MANSKQKNTDGGILNLQRGIEETLKFWILKFDCRQAGGAEQSEKMLTQPAR
jgi:hypothetical protein